MYVAKIPNRTSPPTYLLRESYRENGHVKNRTIANISHLPIEQIQLLSRVLNGEQLLSADEALRITRSLPHGHVQAVLDMFSCLKLPELIASERCRERDLVLAMIAQRLLYPGSKLATTRLWKNSTLAEELNVLDAEVEDLYQSMDWLLMRQKRIENKLAKRHLHHGELVHYDISSSSYTGRTCVLARFGHNRDGRKDLPCIVYGVTTDDQGRPVAVDVYPGNTGDPSTVPEHIEKLKTRFHLDRVVAVGDRGMLTQAQIDVMRSRPGVGWLSALRSDGIRKLIDKGRLERSLFDEQNLAEISSPDFPGERLVACYNPILAERRRRKRDALLLATEAKLERIAREVSRRKKKPLKKEEIGVKVGRVLNKHKVGKHFRLMIQDNLLKWDRKQEAIEKETGLDGIYVIRTSEPADKLSAAEAVRGYKRLADVEQAFRSLKGLELLVRPIHHHLEDRVKAHLFICLLAYYVQWHLKRAWSAISFADEHLDQHRADRDPVATAKPTDDVETKKRERWTHDRNEVQSFRTLLNELGTQCRNTCELGEGNTTIRITRVTEPTPLQKEAFRLLDNYRSQQA
jgi:transposase